MSHENAFKTVMRDYDRDRRAAVKLRETRERELHEKIPEIKEIDQLLKQNAFDAIKLIVNGVAGREKAQEFKTSSADLYGRKLELMRKGGYPEDYLENVYICGLCRDTGYLIETTEKCRCLKQRLMDKYYELSTIREKMREENFDTFDLRYYSRETDPSTGVSPYTNIQAIYSASVAFAANFGKQFNNLLYYGGTGLGKTFLCSCVAREVLDSGHTVLYVTAPQIFKKLEDRRFNREDSDDPEGQTEMIYDADLLVIDDLGSEFSTVVTGAELFNIMNTRIISKKPTVISTNLSLNDLQNHYSDRIVSRLFGNYKMFRFFGDDIRLAKKLQASRGNS